MITCNGIELRTNKFAPYMRFGILSENGLLLFLFHDYIAKKATQSTQNGLAPQYLVHITRVYVE